MMTRLQMAENQIKEILKDYKGNNDKPVINLTLHLTPHVILKPRAF